MFTGFAYRSVNEVGNARRFCSLNQGKTVSAFRVRTCSIGYLHRKYSGRALKGRGQGRRVFQITHYSLSASGDQGLCRR
ncbi:hypothetical protein D3C75_542970 [compost metagenome]